MRTLAVANSLQGLPPAVRMRSTFSFQSLLESFGIRERILQICPTNDVQTVLTSFPDSRFVNHRHFRVHYSPTTNPNRNSFRNTSVMIVFDSKKWWLKGGSLGDTPIGDAHTRWCVDGHVGLSLGQKKYNLV